MNLELQARQQAGQDEADIIALEKFEPFRRYWVRRMRQKLAEHEDKLKHGDMSHETREITRQRLLLLEELLGITKSDLASAQAIVEQPVTPGPVRPVQVA